jgi:hypothetical protein
VVCFNHQELQYGLFLLFWDCFCFEQLGCQSVCKNRAAWNNHACIEIVLSSLMVFRSLINVTLPFISTVLNREIEGQRCLTLECWQIILYLVINEIPPFSWGAQDSNW